MKKLTLLLSILFTAGVAMAADAPADSKAPAKPAASTSSEKTTAKADAKAMTHNVTAEVVSVNAEKKELTIKDDKGESHTAPVEGKAIAELKSVKAGEKVTVTCRDNEKGEHQAITAIKPAAATSKKPASTTSETKTEKSTESSTEKK
jgi:hypothetical protein